MSLSFEDSLKLAQEESKHGSDMKPPQGFAALQTIPYYAAQSSVAWQQSDKYTHYDDYSDDSVSTVDDKKNVTISNNQPSLTQESNSQLIPFEMPRYYDGFDLMQTKIMIHFVNKDGGEGRSSAVNVYYNDTTIRFAWLVNKNATAAAGNLRFEIEARGVNSKGEPYCWKSRPNASLNVEQSLSGNGMIKPDNSWINGFFDLVAEETAKAQGFAKDAKAQADASHQSADAAAQSAANAKTSADKADEAKSQAALSATNAAASAQQASEAKNQALGFKNQASSAADAAALSAQEAKGYADAAKQSDASAKQAAANADALAKRAEAAKSQALNASTQAASSAQAAASSASNARSFADSAKSSSDSAKQAASNAETSKQQANVSAQNAKKAADDLIGTDGTIKANEELRVQAETLRQQNFETLTAQSNKATTNANNAAKRAEDAVQEIKKQDFYGSGAIIARGTDLNSVKSLGRYYSPDDNNTASLLNTPDIAEGFTMVVEGTRGSGSTGSVTSCIQRIFGSSTSTTYGRTFTGDSWSLWKKTCAVDDGNPIPVEDGGTGANSPYWAAQRLSFATKTRPVILASDADLNTVIEPGSYASTNYNNNIANCPRGDKAFRLEVLHPIGSPGFVRQELTGYWNGQDVYHRYYNSKTETWMPWERFQTMEHADARYAQKVHTHAYAGAETSGGTANSAAKLATPRRIELTGAVTGAASFDGTGDVSIATTGDAQRTDKFTLTQGCYAKRNGKIVSITVDTSANITANRIYTIGNLPVAYRPNTECCNSLAIQNVPTSVYISVSTAGNVSIINASGEYAPGQVWIKGSITYILD